MHRRLAYQNTRRCLLCAKSIQTGVRALEKRGGARCCAKCIQFRTAAKPIKAAAPFGCGGFCLPGCSMYGMITQTGRVRCVLPRPRAFGSKGGQPCVFLNGFSKTRRRQTHSRRGKQRSQAGPGRRNCRRKRRPPQGGMPLHRRWSAFTRARSSRCTMRRW